MRCIPVAAALLTLGLVLSAASAQTDTAFTYQGHLEENGIPVDGAYDIDFELYDALTGGAPVVLPVSITSVSITEGLFTVELDFGAAAFVNSQRWLEITVHGLVLSPRQPITRTPYSIQTRGIFVNDDLRVGVNTTLPSPETQLHVTSTTNDNFGILTDVFGLPATSIGLHAGGSGHSSLAKNCYYADGEWRYFDPAQGAYLQEVNPFGSVTFYVAGPSGDPGNPPITWIPSIKFVAATGDVGIGTTSPQYPLHVESATTAAVFGRTTSPTNSGVYGLVGTTSGASAGVRGETMSALGTGVFGRSQKTSGVGYGVRGFSNSFNGYDFYAGGVGIDYGTASSIRWKNNVRNIDSPLAKLAALRGVYFDWDETHGGTHDMGMIAEEVGKVLPEIVAYEENGYDAHGMDYAKLTPLLVEAVNALRAEQGAQIENLRLENAELREQLKSLSDSVEQLTNPED